MAGLRRLAKFIGCCTVLGSACITSAQESEVKCAYIFNFAKYTTVSGSGPYVVGIIGDGPISDQLGSSLTGRSITSRPIQIRRFSEPTQDLKKCSLLYIAPSEQGRLAKILSFVKSESILTVSDSPGFASKGVMLNMVLVDGKIRFEVNIASARTARVEIGAKLISLAKEVIGQ